MYLVEDESFNQMMGGEYYQVILAKQHQPKISIRKLYNFQFNFFSYQGFRKFFKRHLEPVIDGIKIIEDKSIIGKIIRWLSNAKKL